MNENQEMRLKRYKLELEMLTALTDLQLESMDDDVFYMDVFYMGEELRDAICEWSDNFETKDK